MSVRFGVAGTGAMAVAILPAIRGAGGEAFAVSSRDGARARSFAAANAIPKPYDSYADMLRDQTIEAIYVASVTAAHADDSIAALQAGKHVLCEKPFAMSEADGQRVIDAGRASGKLFMEGLWTHFLPAYARLHDIARASELGPPQHLSAAYGYPVSKQTRPRLFDPTDGGVIFDLGVYPVSLAIRLMGPVADLSATVSRDNNNIDTHLAAHLIHESGAVSQIAASFDALLSNMAVLSAREGGATILPPLFGAERVSIDRYAPGPPRAGEAGLKEKLKKHPLARRFKQMLTGRSDFYSYGADQYLPQMTHFLNLIAAGKRESDVATHELSLETLRILGEIRAKG